VTANRASIGRGVAWAGLVAGPTAWGIAFQAGYALADLQCAHGIRPTPWLFAAAIILALLGAVLSWRAFASELDAAGTRRFLAGVSALAALLFAAVIALQLVATLIFTGCEQ